MEIDGRHTIHSVQFAENGKQIVAGDTDGVLRRWGTDTRGEVGEAIRAGARISAVVLSPNRQWLVCGLHGSRSNVKMWDVGKPGKAVDIKGHTDTVTSVDISCDSAKLATGSNDKRVCIWDTLKTQKHLLELQHEAAVVAVRFSPNGGRLATATAHSSICIYNSKDGRRLLKIPCPFFSDLASPLAWSGNGCQLYAASYMNLKHFKIFPGRFELLGEWPVSGGSSPSCIALSRNQKFIAAIADKSLSFWDAVTHKQIGPVIDHDGKVCSMVLSPGDDSIATGEERGKITVRSLRDILSDPYLPVTRHVLARKEGGPHSAHTAPLLASRLLFMHLSDATLEAWIQGELAHVEQLLTEEIQSSSEAAHLFAHRALARCRLKRHDDAVDDAQKSIDIQSSVVGHIALIIARVCKGECNPDTRLFDPLYTFSPPIESNHLLLIRAILLFEYGKCDNAVSLVNELIRPKHNGFAQMSVKAQMLFQLGIANLHKGKPNLAAELLADALATISTCKSPWPLDISLIFGWDFDNLSSAIQKQVQECIISLEDVGDAARESNVSQEAIKQYSAALDLKPLNPSSLLIKRSKAHGLLASWEDALRDAVEAIKADSQNPLAYERKYVALHALQRHNEAVDALDLVASLTEKSLCGETRQLADNFTLAKQKIEMAARDVLKKCPFVLIDVEPPSGLLCDRSERIDKFKSESQFKELVSSMTIEFDIGRIRQVVAEYFQYVTFSHVWEGKEPSYQDVKKAKSVWKLDLSPLNNKLRKFCEMVRRDGHRWAWSDTCCINKEDRETLHESLHKMYEWYEESTATFAFLTDVNSPPTSRRLKDSKWMTRAWTSQELLAPKVIRFYDRNWKPYLGDTRVNHKESSEIMQELGDIIGLAQRTIRTFTPGDLSVRAKLRLASTREATREEDIAYSLIGIFKSDIKPHYGEGASALGNLLAEIIGRSGDVTALSWTGKSSSYNSCLPASLAVYQHPFHLIAEAEMDKPIARLKGSLSQGNAMLVYKSIMDLPPARFLHRRLQLPCIIFVVKQLDELGHDEEYHYQAEVSGVGNLDFHTLDQLPLAEPRKLIFVHPWIRNLCDPADGFSRMSDDEAGAEVGHIGGYAPRLPLHPMRTATIDNYARAFRLLARLQQPFRALLLLQQDHKEFKRVASEHEIIVPGLDPKIDFTKDICAEVVEIL